MPTPLPFPAEELRTAAHDQLTNAELDIHRLYRFFREHDKDTSVLQHMLTQIASAQARLRALEWPSTNAQPPFPLPTVPASPTPN